MSKSTLTITCQNCERKFVVGRGASTVECLGCYTVIKNPLYDENLYKNGRRRKRPQNEPDAHEDASDRDLKCGKALCD